MNVNFNEFDAVSYSEWLSQIETDLKGKSIDILHSKPEPDLDIKAYHHAAQSTYKSPLLKRAYEATTNEWRIRQEFNEPTDQATNTKILNALNDGVNHIGFTLNEKTDVKTLMNNILFQHIDSDFKFENKEAALSFTDTVATTLNFDTIALNAVKGNSINTLTDFKTFVYKNKASKTICVNGYNYGAAGATTVQEIAFAAAHANEYIQYLINDGYDLDKINAKMTIELSVNDNYFVNIAKFRVIRHVIDLIFKHYDPDFKAEPIVIYAKTNIRHLAKNDKNNNALRETTQAMSAVIGGADVLTVSYGKTGTDDEVERFERIAKNIQLVLKEEAYLDKVIDPSAGAYFMEALHEQLLEKSWDLFLKVEAEGGLIAALKSNFVQNKIEEMRQLQVEALNNKSKTFLGVNKYPNGMEDWVTVDRAEEEIKNPEFKPLLPFYLESELIKNNEAL